MNKENIVIVDYGVGNTYSVYRALEKCGAVNVTISNNSDEIKKADKLILPGVGAFENGMNGLKSRNLIDAVVHHGLANKPLLGICLGMQLLTTSSEEFGFHHGLGLIPGKVTRMSEISSDGGRRKIPFIGWSKLIYETSIANVPELFSEIPKDASIYLVHSYAVKTDSENNLMASYYFGDERITAAIKSNNIFGLQFHPEKSGPVGLQIINNFLHLKT